MVTFFLVNPERASSSIGIIVSFKGRKYRRSIGESIPVKYWSKTKKRVKVSADFTYGNIVNDVINKWNLAAMRTMAAFKEYMNPPIPEDFFERLDREYYKDSGSKQDVPYFTDYLETYINRYENARSEITIKHCITTRNKLLEYERRKRRRLSFKNIDITFYNDFRSWIFQQGYSDNYFGSLIKIIKQAYKEARNVDKLHDCRDIENRNFVTVATESDNVYLTEEELQRIHRLNITPELIAAHYKDLDRRRIEQKIKSLDTVRQRFLIGAYTGLRVSDFARLGNINIGDFIRITTTKTKTPIVIPIHPVIAEILANGFDPSVTVSDQKINVHIKELARLAGITDKVLLNKHVGGEVVEIIKEKCDLVSTHTARRSFATNAYKAGVPTIAIMKITGHKKESTFLKYIKISEEENAEMLKNHPFFTAHKNAEPPA